MKSLPNILTLSRIFLTFIFIYFVMQNTLASIIIAAIIFTIASLTDYFDGALAKKMNLSSDFGKIMDPIADKFLILATFFVFTDMDIFPSWIFLVVLLREFLITGVRFIAMSKGKILVAEKAGKIKTVSQIFAITLILIFLLLLKTPVSATWSEVVIMHWYLGIHLMMLIVVGLTYYSGISYLWNNRESFRL